MAENILGQGFSLMVFGMGTVFVFLTLLVFLTSLMSYLVRNFLPEDTPAPIAPNTSEPGQSNVDPRTLAILQAAVDAYRGKKN